MSKKMQEQVKCLNKAALEEAQTEPIDKTTLTLLYGLEQLDDVMFLFMTVTETLLAQLESAIQNKDVSAVRRMAHELKGSSYAVSAREMSQVCLSLEAAGEEKNWREVEKLYTTLGLAFARVREFLARRQEKLRQELEQAS